ncbi:MAG: hypothetical protein ACO1RA_17895 [Planctomycetaceae bacterium]
MSTTTFPRLHSVKKVSLLLAEEPYCKPAVINTLNRLASRLGLGQRTNPDKRGPRLFSDADVEVFASVLQGKVGRPRTSIVSKKPH